MFFPLTREEEEPERVHCADTCKERCRTALAPASSAARQHSQHGSREAEKCLNAKKGHRGTALDSSTQLNLCFSAISTAGLMEYNQQPKPVLQDLRHTMQNSNFLVD